MSLSEPHQVIHQVEVYLPDACRIVRVLASPDVRRVLVEMAYSDGLYTAGTRSQQEAIGAAVRAEEAYLARVEGRQ